MAPKTLISGSALFRLNGVSYAGIDETHICPYSCGETCCRHYSFSRHDCRGFVEKTLVIVDWELFRKGLLLLELIHYIQGLPRDDPLRRELEALLQDNLASLEVKPTIEQIVFSHILCMNTVQGRLLR